MYLGISNQRQIPFGSKFLEIWSVLEEVGVDALFFDLDVGLDVVGVLDDLDLDARIRGQVVVNVVQDLRVRRGGRADLQGVDVGGGGGGGAAGAGRPWQRCASRRAHAGEPAPHRRRRQKHGRGLLQAV